GGSESEPCFDRALRSVGRSRFALPFQIANDLLAGKCWMVDWGRPHRKRSFINGAVADLFGPDPAWVPRAVHFRHELLAIDRPLSGAGTHGPEQRFEIGTGLGGRTMTGFNEDYHPLWRKHC